MEGVDSLPSPNVVTLLVAGGDIGDNLLSLSTKNFKENWLRKEIQVDSGIERTLLPQSITDQYHLIFTKIVRANQMRQMQASISLQCAPDWHQPVCPAGTQVEIIMSRKEESKSLQEDTSISNVTFILPEKLPTVRGVVSRELPDYKHLWVSVQKRSQDIDNEVLTSEELLMVSQTSDRLVPTTNAYRISDFTSCASSPLRITSVRDSQACQTQIVAHVPALCGHNELLPPEKKSTQTVHCGADQDLAELDDLDRPERLEL